MSAQKNSLSTLNANDVHPEKPPALSAEGEIAVRLFINSWNGRSGFFSEEFVRKVSDGNRKALGELQRYPMPPTAMDLRTEFAKCIRCSVPGNYKFSMVNGAVYSMDELRTLVPKWATVAEVALIKSDPVLADKLMSPLQWNAKSAFEVIFVTAMNELKNMKKTNQVSGTMSHYHKWILNPLKDAIAQVKLVAPPSNCLIGYGNKISLEEAMKTAETLEEQFHKLLQKNFSNAQRS